jgi:hypothetical protein
VELVKVKEVLRHDVDDLGAREADAPRAHVARDDRLGVVPRHRLNGLHKVRAHKPQLQRLLDVKEAQDALAAVVRAVELRKDRLLRDVVAAVRDQALALGRLLDGLVALHPVWGAKERFG